MSKVLTRRQFALRRAAGENLVLLTDIPKRPRRMVYHEVVSERNQNTPITPSETTTATAQMENDIQNDNIGECATTSNNFYTVEQHSESEDEEFNFIHTRARRTVLPSNLTTDQNTQINIDTRRQEIKIKHLQTVLKQEIVLSKEISVGSQTIQGFAAKKKVVEDERDKKIKEINENADATLKNLDAEKQKTLNIIKNNKEKLIKIQKALATLDEALN
ncbi:unnamed protein product [Chironomus riparius]|uniref:Uncharacterized protein n=1 Tax=Chironomus riparius TaxID=315576 RepID=A0A9N9RI56_9DIPT|nr:unnamed protein product [Chironomus riparius]